ncbi:hypothetical protein TNCV_920721 [Trichonephila clavipes]|nr:hypothetical protein TNCV_920721 [Trichonephila clavipes]
MDVYKCILLSWHGGTLNSSRDASPLGRFMEGEERWEAPDHPQVVLPQNWPHSHLAAQSQHSGIDLEKEEWPRITESSVRRENGLHFKRV